MVLRIPAAAPGADQEIMELGHGGRRPFVLPPLPFAAAALPVISARTIDVHYNKHHAGYLLTLNRLLAGHPLADRSLVAVIRGSAGQTTRTGIFNNAAQVWNHSFYWHSLTPQGGGQPGGSLGAAIIREFGSYAAFRQRLINTGVEQFGSGWAWLCAEGDRLTLRRTGNADTPVHVPGVTPLLTIDVWEHAYYLDYQNRRAEYAGLVIDRLLNWSFAARNFEAHQRLFARPGAEIARTASVPAVALRPLPPVVETRSGIFSRLARSR
ncbi:MAG: superoxide dismutase [Rhodospirillaceae bacterium]